jgi:hypothetical protein
MKLIQLAGLAVLMTLGTQTLAHEATVASLDEDNGFRGVKFGAQISDFKNLKLIEDGAWNFFSRENDSLKLGAAELMVVSYGFYKDELGAVILKTTGPNCAPMLKALKESYGSPRQPNEHVQSYFWGGRRVYLSFDRNDITDKCYATFISMPVHEKASADEKTAESGSQDESGENSVK